MRIGGVGNRGYFLFLLYVQFRLSIDTTRTVIYTYSINR